MMMSLRFTSLILFAAIVAFAVNAAPAAADDDDGLTKERAKEIANECKMESGATDDDIERMVKHEPAESHESKCLRACMMKKFEIMDESGKLSKDNAITLVKVMSKDDADKEAAGIGIVEECVAIEVPDDHCDAAAAYEACMLEQMRERGLSLSGDD